MGSSLLQAAIIGKLLQLIGLHFGDRYLVLTNELGILFSKKHRRAADIAIVDREKVKDKLLENRYLDIPPKVVIEIDTKADREQVEDTFGYFHQKRVNFWSLE